VKDNDKKSEGESVKSEEKLTCRICLAEEEEGFDPENPMISPCKCDGTMKHIHLTCLKEWLVSRRTVKENGLSASYIWKSLDCELCKESFPPSVMSHGKKQRLTEIQRPPGCYMILESTNHKQIHVISMEH